MPKGLLIDDDDELGHATFGPRRRSRASDQVEQRECGEMTLCAVVVRTGIWKWAMELASTSWRSLAMSRAPLSGSNSPVSRHMPVSGSIHERIVLARRWRSNSDDGCNR